MKRFGTIISLLIFGLITSLYWSQLQAIAQSYPIYPLTTTNLAGSIVSGGTFQSIVVAGPRNSCVVANNGSSTQWVFFGPIASATHAKSWPLSAGASVNCNVMGNAGVITDQVSIDGSTSDTYYAATQ